jgi:pyruvate dehydrogenase E1 component
MSLDIDPIETQEWLDALASLVQVEGEERAAFILKTLMQSAQDKGLAVPGVGAALTTPYRNTIPPEKEINFPGDLSMERRIRALIRWNAAAMVVRAGKVDPDLGGHIGTFASSAMLYDVGFNHFWHAATDTHGGDLLYIQGHSSPGIYARSFLEGRLSEEQLVHFRRESKTQGLSSYPHPWLMPDYWQFPTVSMGLGPMQAIYQARLLQYLKLRGLPAKTANRRVWAFCGDGEMDEPESVGALSVAAREGLDNLIFVINCNLQKLDGPVRGNGKVIQELEGIFKGAGWNVIKVIWGHEWDELLAKDHTGILQKRMEEVIDGDYQSYAAKGGAYTREHFFGKYPELAAMVADKTDDEIWRLSRGGHDAKKMYNAYLAAVNHTGQPTVILAKTIKGYGLGSAGEGLNIAHNAKKMAVEQLRTFRDRFDIPIPDEKIAEVPFYRPAENSPEIQYLKERRAALGGYLPARRREATQSLAPPEASLFDPFYQSSGDRALSTTMGFVRILTALCKHSTFGKQVVPIVPDEARTFGMEGLYRQFGIYSPVGQLYKPVDAEQVMSYREAKDGQIIEEGINEAGSFCTWLAAATSYSTHDCTLMPFYIYYSMFGFQRIGDLAWAAGDSRARGFLIGGTAGRTTLNGEGLQHEDGHSHILANTIPNCISYDPCFLYELAVIIKDGLRRMLTERESVFYYITVMNENYTHPALPEGAEEGILKGLYRLMPAQTDEKFKLNVQLLGCGTILREVLAARDLLSQDFDVAAEVWSATSFNLLGREAQDVMRWNRFHPDKPPREPYVTSCLKTGKGPVVAATDYMQAFADQIRAFVPREYQVLGTDGFGRSDTREALRVFFEVNRYYIVLVALQSLVNTGALDKAVLNQAILKYGLDPEKPNPVTI